MLFSPIITKDLTLKSLPYNKTAKQILIEEAKKFSPDKTYDIFLSHSYSDAEIIYGIKLTIEKMGYTTYVDWVEDPSDRTNVTSEIANLLKKRMKVCKCLFSIVTESSPNSKWMPWELGYFDGFKNKVAILPVKQDYQTNNYKGQEYLGLYPYVTDEGDMLMIHNSVTEYINFRIWLNNEFD